MTHEYDLAIVGFGAAGAAAALTAARRGAKVLLIEKQPADAHYSSTRMSGGLFMGADDVEEATRYLDACSGGMIPIDVSRAWAERAVSVERWAQEMGISSMHAAGGWYPKLPGFESIKVYAPLPKGADPSAIEYELPAPGELAFKWPVPFGNGQTLHDLLVEAVEAEADITCIFECEAQRLIQDGGRVSGVLCKRNGDEFEVRASRGVVLASGGFEQNQEMILNYLKAYPIYFYGATSNTGDGIKMAQAVGADLWHMNQMIGRAVGHFKHPDGREMTFNVSLNPPGYVIVDKYGRRFANEYLQAVSKPNFYYEMLHYDADLLEHPRIPSYWIFDKRRIEARPVSGGSYGHYAWSPDNRAEIDLGWIAEADTVEEAARLAGCPDPEAAARTVAQYNQGCAEGVDAHGRPESSLVPLEEGPFYCVPVYPGGATTNGGPRRDAKARILTPHGEPIPGLFGAGELGGAIGILYPSPGANLGEAFAFGAIAAETALSQN
ncbi:FAD-dependent oxidoreductase [Sphingosinithalassobacter portus]|uniref:FAD-dependent oxidoreductase n=1 Tax=Stakelama portus TaxID=2676234 RepID=UPI000D6DCD6D|nr:FAD-dependent oxidoreductase [Sphingosinithalassobacter portus]